MYRVFVSLPKDMTELNKRYNEVMVKITKKLLTPYEINELIRIYDERNEEKA
jgi:hypothetical protein